MAVVETAQRRRAASLEELEAQGRLVASVEGQTICLLVGEGEQLAAPVGRRVHLQERELALDRLAGLELVDAEHVHELVHLLLDLLERLQTDVRASRMKCVTLPLTVLQGALEGREVAR